MAETFELEIATPERLLVREQVREVQVPALNGYMGILPDHSPVLSMLGTGVLSYQYNGERAYLSVSGGFVEVLDNRVRVLTHHAEGASEVDMKRAEEALKRAMDRLSHPDVTLDVARALNAMKRAEARLAAAKQAGK